MKKVLSLIATFILLLAVANASAESIDFSSMSEEQLREYPLSGSVFCCKPGVKGVRANCFGE